MRYQHYTSCKLGPDGKDVHHLGVMRTPTFWDVWETICERICRWVFRDRFCHLIAGPAMSAAEKRTERFEDIEVSADWAERYYAWRGWNPWWIDEEDDD